MKVLFDLRDHPDDGLVRIANQVLERQNPTYFERYGRVASEKWWAVYDSGHISRTLQVGKVRNVGPIKDEFDEEAIIVSIETDRGTIEYDRTTFWQDPALEVGAWVHVETAKVIVEDHGPHTAIILVRVSVE